MTSSAALLPKTAPAPGRPATVLVVDDDEGMRRLLAWIVERGGNRPLIAGDVPEAIEVLDAESVDLVITDLHLPGLGGLDLLAELSARPGSPPSILVTGMPDTATVRAARLLGARAVVEKPFSIDLLLHVVDDAVRGSAEGGHASPGERNEFVEAAAQRAVVRAYDAVGAAAHDQVTGR
jgi:DNA-binding NtrC family response regulator